jgi:glycerophosphoryl diester phosphodiesterase
VLRRRIYRGPSGTRVVRAMTFEELRRWDCGSRRNRLFRRQQTAPGARIPALEEVLALAPRAGFGFTIEVKSTPLRPRLTPPPDRYAELLACALRRHGLESRTIVQSFDFRVLDAVRRLAPSIPLSGLCGFDARDFVAIARQAGSRMVGPYHRMVTRGRVDAAHEAGIQVVPWTANRPRDWVRLIEAGVDGIITDDPAALIRFLHT